jgi:ProP effector
MNAADTLPPSPSTPAVEHPHEPTLHAPTEAPTGGGPAAPVAEACATVGPPELAPAERAAQVAQAEEPVVQAGSAPAAAGLSPEQTAERLVQMFPALFGPEGPRLPIKLRIQADIQQRAPEVFSRRALSYVLSHATSRTAYLKRLVQDSQRYDLDGQPAGEVAPEHRQAAVDELARRKGLFDARRATQRTAAGARATAPGDGPSGPEDGAPLAATLHAPLRAQPQAPRRPPGHAAAMPRGHQSSHQSSHQSDHPRGDRSGDRPRDQGRPDQGRPQGPMQARGQGPATAQPRQRPPRAEHPQRPNPAPSAGRAQPAAPRAERMHEADPARRERALLLRAFESSPLSTANFCALKRLDLQTLEAELELARKERSSPR